MTRLLFSLLAALPLTVPAYALNDFSGTGTHQALSFETSDAQWSVASGAYQNRVTGINPGTAVVSSASLPLADALTAETITMKTQFTVDSFATPPGGGTPTTGFGLLASTSNFSGTAPQSYYLADFAFADGVNLNNEGRIRILSLGAANADFSTTAGVADANPDTLKTAVVPGTAYTLILTATRDVSGLSLTLGLYEADGVTQIGTPATAFDPTPLTGTFFGYRNRYESGSTGGVYQLTFDNLDLQPDPDANPPSGLAVVTAPAFPLTPPFPATSTSALVLKNLSPTAPVTVTAGSLTGADPGLFSITTPLPLTIPAAGSVPVEILFNPAGQSGIRHALLTLDTNAGPALPAQTLTAGFLALNNNSLGNPGFENSPFPDRWTARLGSALNALAVPGLRAPSTTAAWLSSSNIELVQPVLSGSHWYAEATFAVSSTAFERGFNMVIKNQNPGTTAVRCINLRYDVSQQSFNCFADQAPINDGWGAPLELGTIEASTDANFDGDLEDAEDVKNTYRIRVTGHGWGKPGATFDVELTEANSAALTRKVIGLQRFQTTHGSAAVPTAMGFTTEFGNNPGFWVDDAVFVSTAPPVTPLAIGAFSYSPPGGTVQFTHTAPLGLAYRIQGSNDLGSWENLSDELGQNATLPFTETPIFAAPARFYRLSPR